MVVSVALAVAMLWLTIRLVRAGILISGDGVTFRNYLRTRCLRWDEIQQFEPPAPYGRRRNAGLRASLFTGRVVYSSVYGAGPFTRRGFADDIVVQLNGLLGAARPSASQTDPRIAG
jgi:hypothetical protein